MSYHNITQNPAFQPGIEPLDSWFAAILSKFVIIAIVFAFGCLLGTNLALAKYVLRSIATNADLRRDLTNAFTQIAAISNQTREVKFGGEYRVNDQGEIVLMAK